MAQLKDLVVAGPSRLVGPTYGSSLTLSGTLILSNTTDLSGTSYTGPALIVGGNYTAAHMEIDANEIQAKTNSATTASLYLNNDGGTVYANGQAIVLTNDTRLSNARTPTAHASTATTYGVGTTANYGHVKLVSGELASTTGYNDGQAAAAAHTHAQYLTAIQHRSVNVNTTPLLTTAGTALTLSAGTGISLSGDINSNGVVTINCTVTGGGGSGSSDGYHVPIYTSGLRIASGFNGVNDLFVPTGTTATTVALGNHTHSNYLTSHLYRPISLNGTSFLTNSVATQLNLADGYGIQISSGDNGTATIATTGQSIPFVVGTGTDAGYWSATCGEITQYTEGQLLLYKIPVAGLSGSGNTRLKVNNLAEKKVYIRGTTVLTTHFAKNSIILLVYNSSLNSNAGGWECIDDYWTNSNTWRNIRLNGSTTNFLDTGTGTGALNISAGTGISVTGASGVITIANTVTDTNTWRSIKVNGTQKLDTTITGNALGFSAGTGISLSESSGTITIANTVTNTDEKVAYTSKTDNVNYPIIFGNAATPTSPGGVSYNSTFYYNPSDKRLSFTKLRFLHATDTTAYIDIGLPSSYASASSIHFPWFNKDTDAANAMYLVGKIVGHINGPLEITSAGRIQPLTCSKKGTILWYNGSTWTALTPPSDLQDHILHISSGNAVYWSGTSPS